MLISWSSSHALSLIFSDRHTVFRMFLKHIKLFPILGPFLLLFTLPAVLFPQISMWLCLSHRSHLSSILSQRDFLELSLLPNQPFTVADTLICLLYSYFSLVTESSHPLEEQSLQGRLDSSQPQDMAQLM